MKDIPFQGGPEGTEYDRNKGAMSPTYLILFTSSAQLFTLLPPQPDCYLLEGLWMLNTVLHATQEEGKWTTNKCITQITAVLPFKQVITKHTATL